MKNTRVYRSIVSILPAVLWFAVSVGTSDAFGKNKITYVDFGWVKHETDHFEFYYYPECSPLLPETIRFFETAYLRVSDDLGTELSDKTPVVLYKSHSDFQQTNILEGFIPQGVAGFSEPIKRRIVIPLDGSKKALESLIIHELVHTFEFEILFQNRLNRISPVPIWIMEGFAEHIAGDWDAVGRMVLRDAVISNILPSLEQMDTFDYLPSPYLGYKAAQSAVDFIRNRYGIHSLRALMWELRKTLRTENYFRRSVKETFGITLDELSEQWKEDLRRRVIEIERRREGITSFDKTLQGQKKYYRRFAPVFSPGSELIAYMENGPEGFNVFLGTTDPEKKEPVFDCLTCDLDREKYRNVVTDGRPLNGNPWDDRLVYISVWENRHYIHLIDPAVGGLAASYPIPQDQPASPALSPDGMHVAFSGFKDAQSDLFILDMSTGETSRITNDAFIDETPAWSPDGEWLVYSTERDGQFDLFRVAISDANEQPVILSPGNETMPSWSPDGESIAYISDRIDGINDPYIMNLLSGEIHRIAAPVTGMFTPSFSEDGSEIAVAYYVEATQRVIVIPVDREVVVPDVAKDEKHLGPEGEVLTYTPPQHEIVTGLPESPSMLQNQKVKFRLVPDIAIGQISYGTDGDLAVEGGLIMSDILGNHQFSLLAIRRDNRNGIRGSYIYLPNRIDYGVVALQDSDYYYRYNFTTGLYHRVEWDYYGGMLHAEYPLTTFYRFELDYGVFIKNYSSSLPGYDNYDEKMSFLEPSFIGDTVRYKPLTGYSEPFSGQRFEISVRYPIALSSDFETFVNTYFDYRAYIPLTRRSLVAFREWGILSSGDNPEYYGLGGFNTIRGYDYATLVGNYFAITNLELRFPLIDRLEFPGGVGFYGFRGKLFADVGAIWSKGEDKEWDFDNPETIAREGNLYGAAGFGFNFWLIGVEWHFEWAKQTDFTKFQGGYVYEWSIRRSF